MKFYIAIISKDRSDYLENLLESFLNNFPYDKIEYEINVFDNSTNKLELSKIRVLMEKYNIKLHTNTNFIKSKSGLGNLYLKMNQALELSIKNNFDYLYFIQDDMQFVRKIYQDEIEKAIKIFKNKFCIHLSCHFHKGFEINYQKKYEYNEKFNLYLNNFSSCSDIGIYDLKKLKSLNFYFKNEHKNDKFYHELNYRSYNLFNPWYHYTPWPVSSRKQSNTNFFIAKFVRNILIWINVIGTKSGLNKYKIMGRNEINTMNNRNKKLLPTAEYYLNTFKEVPKPWAHDISWDFRKFKSIYLIFTLKWIFDGSLDYINNKKVLKKKNLHKNFERWIEN